MSAFCRLITCLRLNHRLFGLTLAAVAAAMLGSVYVLQYAFGFQPCELCLMQRYPVMVVMLLGLLGACFPRNPLAAVPLRLLAMLAFATGGVIAAYQVGIEFRWWQGLTECSGELETDSLHALYQQIMSAPTVRCDEVQFRFLGLSLAAWNVLASIGMIAALSFTLPRSSHHAD